MTDGPFGLSMGAAILIAFVAILFVDGVILYIAMGRGVQYPFLTVAMVNMAITIMIYVVIIIMVLTL